jgi:hypothetical protein
MKQFLIQKQLVPTDKNMGDSNWAKRQIWVLKLNANDSIDEFDTLEEAISKKNELFNDDPTQRVYKVVENINGSYVDIY